jgi:hypothetical protein
MGSAQTNDIVQFGGGKNILQPSIVLPFANVNNLIQLSALISSSTSGNFLMLSRWSSAGSAQYQVNAAKHFYACGIFVYTNTANIQFTVGYGTAALGSDNTGTPPTGAVYFSSGSGVSSLYTDATGWNFYPLFADFPASSYPFIKTGTSANNYNIVLLGTEA